MSQLVTHKANKLNKIATVNKSANKSENEACFCPQLFEIKDTLFQKLVEIPNLTLSL